MDMKTAVIYRLEELIRQKDTFWCSAINAEEYFVWAE